MCDGKSMESTLLPLMDAIAAVGMRVMVSVKDWMQQSRDHRTGGPGSQTYERLKNTTDLLGNHRALLGCETAILSLDLFAARLVNKCHCRVRLRRLLPRRRQAG